MTSRWHPFKPEPRPEPKRPTQNAEAYHYRCAEGVSRPEEVHVPTPYISKLTPQSRREVNKYIQHIVVRHAQARMCKEAATALARHYLQRFRDGFEHYMKVTGGMPETSARKAMRWL